MFHVKPRADPATARGGGPAAFHVNLALARYVTSGATTRWRSGSSPSL
jgi:hypothetical protein